MRRSGLYLQGFLSNTGMAKSSLHCSFCGKNRDDVKILIAGQDNVHICDQCVESAREILEQEVELKSNRFTAPGAFKLNVKKPREIKQFLDQYVIGQDDAKKNWA